MCVFSASESGVCACSDKACGARDQCEAGWNAETTGRSDTETEDTDGGRETPISQHAGKSSHPAGVRHTHTHAHTHTHTHTHARTHTHTHTRTRTHTRTHAHTHTLHEMWNSLSCGQTNAFYFKSFLVRSITAPFLTHSPVHPAVCKP